LLLVLVGLAEGSNLGGVVSQHDDRIRCLRRHMA